MKVFLSWSGNVSKQVATELRDWLPRVIQAIEPWMSSEDIEKGARWSSEVATKLKDTTAGIICVTSDNRDAPWLNFEAGALSKMVDDAMVCPYLFRLKPADLTGPLVQFQLSESNKEDTKRLLQSINKELKPKPLTEKALLEQFELLWPKLESNLAQISVVGSSDVNSRSEKDMLEEILDSVRGQAKTSDRILRVVGARDLSDMAGKGILTARLNRAFGSAVLFNDTPSANRIPEDVQRYLDLETAMNRSNSDEVLERGLPSGAEHWPTENDE